tara:strand:- start:8478 stop:8756 length:279 start_codon:yes stop_codon:yes gene_type:complete
LADTECWRLHHSYTLRHWFNRFIENEDHMRSLYDARVVRLWLFYLAACEQPFWYGRQAVFQAHPSLNNDAVPLTRNWLYWPAPGVAVRRAAK